MSSLDNKYKWLGDLSWISRARKDSAESRVYLETNGISITYYIEYDKEGAAGVQRQSTEKWLLTRLGPAVSVTLGSCLPEHQCPPPAAATEQ